MNRQVILAITGGSGAAYAVRLLDVLLASGHDVHLSISPAGRAVLRQELEIDVDLGHFDPALLRIDPARLGMTGNPRPADGRDAQGRPWVERPAGVEPGRVVYHAYTNLMAPIASGSFRGGGMVVCPCSGGTLAAIATGTSQNLIQRAADVQLKERRKLILVPRETPLSLVHLDNMRRATEVGAVVLPAMPGWYHGVRSVFDLIDFLVARICDQLGIEQRLMHRWGGADE
ncbi:MAG: UbiX family flavin prenyltransferase [Pirellulales bacterium]|nr:UbiX family flavin prenyltransferase [Pirellulales bacterium]